MSVQQAVPSIVQGIGIVEICFGLQQSTNGDQNKSKEERNTASLFL